MSASSAEVKGDGPVMVPPRTRVTWRVFTDGGCTGNHHKRRNERRAGYGIFIEPQTPLSEVPAPPIVDAEPTADSPLWHLSAALAPPLTNNRAEMMALIHLLELVVAGSTPFAVDDHVIVHCDNRYVIDSATKWLPGWRKRGYCKADGSEVQNVDLVRRLDTILCRAARQRRSINIRWIRAHEDEPVGVAHDDETWRNWFGNRHADWLANWACGVNKFGTATTTTAATKRKRSSNDDDDDDDDDKQVSQPGTTTCTQK